MDSYLMLYGLFISVSLTLCNLFLLFVTYNSNEETTFQVLAQEMLPVKYESQQILCIRDKNLKKEK